MTKEEYNKKADERFLNFLSTWETVEQVSLENLITYELTSSWWASLIWWKWGQTLVANYFVWKTKRKFKRYQKYELAIKIKKS